MARRLLRGWTLRNRGVPNHVITRRPRLETQIAARHRVSHRQVEKTMRENENYEDAATSHGGTAVGIASMTTEVVSLVPPSNNGDLRNHPLKEPEPACLSRVMPELRLIPAVAPDWAGEIKRIWAEGGANTLQLAKIVSMARKQLARG